MQFNVEDPHYDHYDAKCDPIQAARPVKL
jgi:hypothetical protein